MPAKFTTQIVIFMMLLVGSAQAGEVLRVVKNGHLAAVSAEPGQTWQKGDQVCVAHGPRDICGRVVRAMKNGAVVEFRPTPVAVGDAVKGHAQRVTASADTSSAESSMSIGGESDDPFSSSSFASPKGPRFNVTLGLGNIYPGAGLSFALIDKLVVTGMVNMQHITYDTVQSLLVGGSLLLGYYFIDTYKGPFVQGGAGFYNANTQAFGNQANQAAFSFLATAGYRWQINQSNWNVGVSGGLAYYSLASNVLLPFSLNYFMPLVLVEGGWRFNI